GPYRPEPSFVEARHIDDAVVGKPQSHRASGRLDPPGDALPQRALAATPLPHEALPVPFGKFKGDDVHRPDVSGHLTEKSHFQRVVFFQVVNPEKGPGTGFCRLGHETALSSWCRKQRT